MRYLFSIIIFLLKPVLAAANDYLTIAVSHINEAINSKLFDFENDGCRLEKETKFFY